MDSINKNQPEDNYKDLYGEEAAKKIKELAEKAATCFFCTKSNTRSPINNRPMSVQKVDEHGSLWFLSANDSHKNQQILSDPQVNLLFKGLPHSDFLSIYGHATITTDHAIINELWEPILKTWFTEGENDPRITAIKVEPLEGYDWDTKHGTGVAFVKQLVGAAIGKTLDDSIEGKIKV
jgi:general stress protein 26